MGMLKHFKRYSPWYFGVRPIDISGFNGKLTPASSAVSIAASQVELLVDALYDSDAKVQKGAIQSYLHWLAAPSRLSDVVIQDEE